MALLRSTGFVLCMGKQLSACECRQLIGIWSAVVFAAKPRTVEEAVNRGVAWMATWLWMMPVAQVDSALDESR